MGRVSGRRRYPGPVSPSAEPAAAAPTRPVHAGWGLAVVMIGVLITAVDTTIVVLALPEIERGLHVDVASVIWVVIGYLLVITLLATQVGRLGDMFGRVRMYEAGFAVFIAGSALCALSWNGAALIGFRILQGLGGALVTANSGAVIADLFPPHLRGRAYGFNGIGWSAGAVLGIVLGGAIVTYISWRFIFWINVPIGGLAIALALRVLHDPGRRRRHRLDLPGMAGLGLGLFGVLWAVTSLATSPVDPALVGYLVGGIACLALFALIEWRREEPMLQLSLLRVPTMTPSLLAALFQGLANFAVLFLLIMYLQGPRGLSALDASLLLVPGYIVGGCIGPFAGRLADRVGPVIPATFGLGVQILALLVYAQLSTTTPLWVVVAGSVVNGIGNSSFFPANSSAVMKASPPQLFGISSGMLRTFSNVGMVFSFSMALVLASRTIPQHLAFAIFVGSASLHGAIAGAFTNGLHTAFYGSMVLMGVAALLSASRRRGWGAHTRPAAAGEGAAPAPSPPRTRAGAVRSGGGRG